MDPFYFISAPSTVTLLDTLCTNSTYKTMLDSIRAQSHQEVAAE